jgi:signal transduction histidine kinase
MESAGAIPHESDPAAWIRVLPHVAAAGSVPDALARAVGVLRDRPGFADAAAVQYHRPACPQRRPLASIPEMALIECSSPLLLAWARTLWRADARGARSKSPGHRQTQEIGVPGSGSERPRAVELRYSDGSLAGFLLASSRCPGDWPAETDQLLPAVGLTLVLTLERIHLQRGLGELAADHRCVSRSLFNLQEAERRRLAGELHDEIGQLLTTLGFVVRELEAPTPDAMRKQSGQARDLVQDLLARIRSMSADLRPTALDQLGLDPALRTLNDRFTRTTQLKVDYVGRDLDRRFPPEVETAAYRVIQEAMTNAARHAGVAGLRVEVVGDREQIRLVVLDNGRGFDVRAVESRASSGGLLGMRERVALLDGELEIRSEPGRGTCVRARLSSPAGRSRNGEGG